MQTINIALKKRGFLHAAQCTYNPIILITINIDLLPQISPYKVGLMGEGP